MVGVCKGRHQSDTEKNICTGHLLSKQKRGCRDKQNACFNGPEYWLRTIHSAYNFNSYNNNVKF